MALALDNQDIPHNYVQQSVILTTKLDALTLNVPSGLNTFTINGNVIL
ncbi:hypothetical protein RintRC_6487 [Richelia intracellularis]|nr:hypothetical protein RintRC_6487 [Richelia intracellularis]